MSSAIDDAGPMVIRTLTEDDLHHLASLVAGTGADVDAAAQRLRWARDRHPLLALAAWEDGLVGAVWGAFTASGYNVCEIFARAEGLARVVAAFAADLRGRFPGQHVEVCTMEEALVAPAPDARHDALGAAGFELLREQIHVGRSLAGYRAVAPDPFAYRHYESAGKAALGEALAHVFSRGGLPRGFADPLELLDDFLHHAGAQGPDARSLWRLAHLDGRLAGVVLAEVGGASPGVGTLRYIGLVPELRGRGLGAVLHARALQLLADAGALRYEDSTTADNLAMQRVFARNGCEPRGCSRDYRLRRSAPPERLASFEALLAYLRAQDHALAELEAGAWVRTHARSGPHEAPLHLGWIGDAGVLQIVHVFPFAIPGDMGPRVALATCEVNASLSIPGFTYDARARTLGFRLQVPFDRGGDVLVTRLRTAMALAVNTVGLYQAYWQGLVGAAGCGEGGRDPRALLERVPAWREGADFPRASVRTRALDRGAALTCSSSAPSRRSRS